MALDSKLGKKMLQLITSRYDDRRWRKMIEKTLSLPQSGVGDPAQQQIFTYLKIALKAYKSRRADPDSWIVGGYATKEDLTFLGSDPGPDVDEAWWDEMLVGWFEVPEEDTSVPGEGAAKSNQPENLENAKPSADAPLSADR